MGYRQPRIIRRQCGSERSRASREYTCYNFLDTRGFGSGLVECVSIFVAWVGFVYAGVLCDDTCVHAPRIRSWRELVVRWSDCVEVYGYGDMGFVSIFFPEPFGSLCFVWVCRVPPAPSLFTSLWPILGDAFIESKWIPALSVCVSVCLCEWMSLLLSTEWELCLVRFSFLFFLFFFSNEYDEYLGCIL